MSDTTSKTQPPLFLCRYGQTLCGYDCVYCERDKLKAENKLHLDALHHIYHIDCGTTEAGTDEWAQMREISGVIRDWMAATKKDSEE